ncbi:MAG: hypothetical protein MZV64_40630 [Ignavibacteriales bacterium]|nr:hypothetical protein [Ignavibacteriales bacterium]
MWKKIHRATFWAILFLKKKRNEEKCIDGNTERNFTSKRMNPLSEKNLKVLVESVEGDFFVGRSYRDAPEVDGEILINKNNNKIKIGKFYDVVINDYDEYDLFGDILFRRKEKINEKNIFNSYLFILRQ